MIKSCRVAGMRLSHYGYQRTENQDFRLGFQGVWNHHLDKVV